MATSAVVIDPQTGERVQSGGGVQIDPATGERVSAQAPEQAAPDSRNAAQRVFDNLTTVTPEQEKGHSWLVNKAQEFGAGAIQGFGAPIVHPLNTLEGIGNMIAHPKDTGKAMLQSAINNPAQAAGNLVGGAVLGEAAAPVGSLAGKAAGRGMLLGRTPEAAYESALKPSTTLSAAKRANIVQTGLENEIPVSKQGLADIGKAVDNLNQKIADTIATDPNRPISPSSVAQKLNDARAKFSNQVTPQADLNAINGVGKEFMDRFRNPNGTMQAIPAADAQAMKQGTYRVLAGKYGEQGSAAVEAQKSLARGLKEEIAAQFPEINQLNSAESKLLDLQPILERAVNRTANHQLIGIGTPIASTAGEALTGSAGAGAVVGALKMVLDNPMVKSRLAIAVSKGAGIPMARALARVGAYASTLGSYADATPATSGDQTASQ